MIATKELEEIITLTLFSGYLKDEIPVSLLFTAEVEGGKSELAKKFSDNNGVAFPHDVTAYGIQKAYSRRILRKELRHIIFPEFVHCLVRAQDTVKTLLAFLNGLIGEGVKEIHTFRSDFVLPTPLTCGIIACVTTAEFDAWRKYWENMGFLSRLLPVTYSYSQRVEDKIFESIFNRDYTSDPQVYLKFPKVPCEVKISPQMAERLKELSKLIGSPLKIRGFRPQTALQRLAMARALLHHRDVVLPEDVKRINELGKKYMNFTYTEIT